MEPKQLFPLFADLRGRTVVVVGGGAAAGRKVRALCETGAVVNIVASPLDARLAAMVANGSIRHRAERFAPSSLNDAWLAIVATADLAVQRAVVEAARLRHIFVNVVDDADASTVHVPARVRRGRLQVSVSTAGAAPVLARRIRARLDAELDPSLARIADILARERARIRRHFPQPAWRRRFFEQLLDSDWPRRVRDDDSAAQRTFEQALKAGVPDRHTGHVTLVGAGPGDPGLLTLNALRALQRADVILHDRLVGPGILELARRDAERIDVGKHIGENHAATQVRIHDLLLLHAQAGRDVVRLQGGDPMVFGRGGEELEFLRSNAIPFSVVPGVTAALASAAAVGIALTDRRYAHGVTLLTARGRQRRGWAAAAATLQTLAIYMGVGELETVTAELIGYGRRGSTPCVLVERASQPGERRLVATLVEIPTLARAHKVQAPALLIVGEVAVQAARGPCTHQCSDDVRRAAVKA